MVGLPKLINQSISTANLPDYIAAILHQYTVKKLWIGFSGGVDSHVLLHALSQVQTGLPAISAVYINHQLQTQSSQWAKHCQHICAELNIPFIEIKVDGRAMKGESPEEGARNRRYQAWKSLLQENEAILTGQHRDDQAETVLLQLFRGAGPAGLSAMPVDRALAKGRLIRPLLTVTRQQIMQYAVHHELQWIDDPSNDSLDFDRNYLRHQVFPVIQQRWPDVGLSLSQSAQVCAGYVKQMVQSLEAMLHDCLQGDNSLSVNRLLLLEAGQAQQLVRHWVQKNLGHAPRKKQIEQLYFNVLHASDDRQARVCFKNSVVMRYKEGLYWLPEKLAAKNPEIELKVKWSLETDFILPFGQLISEYPESIRTDLQKLDFEVAFRQGGERCLLIGHQHHKLLKHWFQEQHIPHWWRNWIPIIWLNGQVAMVGERGYCQVLDEWLNKGLKLSWEKSILPQSTSVLY
jgi:tRNA(Ile)-lysidine synthase